MQIKEIVEKSSNSSMLEQISDFTHIISNKVKNVTITYHLPVKYLKNIYKYLSIITDICIHIQII